MRESSKKSRRRPKFDARRFFSNGKYLRGRDLVGGEERFTVERAVIDEFKKDGGKSEQRLALKFAGSTERLLPLNKTNGDACMAAWGEDANEWEGREVIAYHDPNIRDPKGVRTGGVRLRFPETGALRAAEPADDNDADVDGDDELPADPPF